MAVGPVPSRPAVLRQFLQFSSGVVASVHTIVQILANRYVIVQLQRKVVTDASPAQHPSNADRGSMEEFSAQLLGVVRKAGDEENGLDGRVSSGGVCNHVDGTSRNMKREAGGNTSGWTAGDSLEGKRRESVRGHGGGEPSVEKRELAGEGELRLRMTRFKVKKTTYVKTGVSFESEGPSMPPQNVSNFTLVLRSRTMQVRSRKRKKDKTCQSEAFEIL